jgi:hypothetical protein
MNELLFGFGKLIIAMAVVLGGLAILAALSNGGRPPPPVDNPMAPG